MPSADTRPTRRRRLGRVTVRVALAAASGLLLHAGFSPRPLWWVVPLAFAGLGLALHGRRWWGSAGYGFVFGLAFNLAHLVWIQDFLGAEFGPAPWLALSGALAVYIALACALMPIVARSEIFGLPLESPMDLIERVRSVTAEDVSEMAGRLLLRPKALALVGPAAEVELP